MSASPVSPSIAVILSGCGYLDGAEIRESVLSLLYLDQAGAQVSIFAPDMPQHHVVDHRSGAEVTAQSRNVLTEAARIARGKVEPLSTLDPKAFDGLVIPGGFGVAKNLSSFAFDGTQASVHPDMVRVIQAFHAVRKPIGAICIAPAVVALALKGVGVTLTIGDDAGCAGAIDATGNHHRNSPTARAVIDSAHRIASCPAYMDGDARIRDVAQGIHDVITAVIDMATATPGKAAS